MFYIFFQDKISKKFLKIDSFFSASGSLVEHLGFQAIRQKLWFLGKRVLCRRREDPRIISYPLRSPPFCGRTDIIEIC